MRSGGGKGEFGRSKLSSLFDKLDLSAHVNCIFLIFFESISWIFQAVFLS